MIDIQRQVKDIMKMVEETNTIIIEMEGNILKTSINNQIMNATNILGILKDLWTLIQSNMENQVYQIQQMLANELDEYKGRENKFVDDNIKEIQELYRDEEIKKEFKVKEKGIQDKEVLLFKPYEKLTRLDTKSSFIQDKVYNLEKHMKFI